MNWLAFDGFIFAILLLVPLVYLQRSLHTEIVSVFLLLTRRQDISLFLYTVLFFPGVFLHEASHWLMAGVLRVPTGRVKLIPERLPDGRLRMGSVEVARAGPLRDSLIGAAPFIFGNLVVAYLGVSQLNFPALLDHLLAGVGGFWPALAAQVQAPYFWLWFYLLFVVSSTMMPSEPDREAWTPVFLTVGALLAVGLLLGVGPWLLQNVVPPINQFMWAAAAVLLMSVVVHALLLLPVLFVRRVLNRITGLRVA